MQDSNNRPGWDSDPTIPLRRRATADPAGGNINKDHELPCTKTARTKTEKLDCLNKLQMLRPFDPAVRAQIYQEVKEVVDHDPFLEYHAENTHAYRVIDRAQQVLIVPKERALMETFPPKRPEPIRKAYRYQVFALLGLFLAGLGGVVFGLLAGIAALSALGKERSRPERVRAMVSAVVSLALFVVGLALVYLLWLHIQG